MELFCIGNALVDIFTGADKETAGHYGISRPVQHIENEKILGILSARPDYTAVSGGGASNVAKIAGFLGAEVYFSGALGKDKGDGPDNDPDANPDHFGRLFKKELSAAGVKLISPLKPSPTGLCLYLSIGDDTRIAASPSAALEFSVSDINEDELKKARVVVIDGYMLGRLNLIGHILHLTDKYGIPAAIDLGSPYIAEKHAADIMEYARQYSLILFMNGEEAAALINARGGSEMCSFFCSLTEGKAFPVVAVKLGAAGAICFAGGKSFRAETTAVARAESTGAGDAFCAGFLRAWVQGKSLEDCAAQGNRTARIVLDAAGTQLKIRN